MGDKLSYERPTATQFARLITNKIPLNTVVSNIMAMFMCADIQNFYYNTPIVGFEYIKIPLRIFPQEFVYLYNRKDLVAADGYVYMDTRKGMPGLKKPGD